MNIDYVEKIAEIRNKIEDLYIQLDELQKAQEKEELKNSPLTIDVLSQKQVNKALEMIFRNIWYAYVNSLETHLGRLEYVREILEGTLNDEQFDVYKKMTLHQQDMFIDNYWDEIAEGIEEKLEKLAVDYGEQQRKPCDNEQSRSIKSNERLA